MAIKPQMPSETFLKDHGTRARRAFQLIEKHSGAARRQWIKIGELASEVKDSAPPRSGVLDRWRAAFLDGKVSKPELSDCIWLYANPKAASLVKDTITNPQNVRRAWREIAKDAAAEFNRAGRNDVAALADQLGISEHEASELVRKSADAIDRARQAAAKRQTEKRAKEMDEAVNGSSGQMFDDPIPFGGDSVLTGTAAIKQALAELDDLDIKAARKTLIGALKASKQ